MSRMGLQRAPVQRFGGLNTVTPPYDLDPEEAQYLQNVRYPVGVLTMEHLRQRQGMQAKLNGFAGGAPALSVGPMENGCDLNGGDLVMSGDGDVWRGLPDDTFAPPTISRIFDGGAYVGKYALCEFSAPSINRRVLIAPCDTPNTPAHQQWDGATCTAWANNFPGGSNVIKSMVTWRGRVVATGTDVARIYYTAVGGTDFIAAGSGTIDLYDQSGSANVELLVHNNNLYLIKQESIWMIYDPVTFANRLLCTVGCGSFQRHISVSCPVDRRIYWFNQRTGLIYSSNGEVDFAVENSKAPVPNNRTETTSWNMMAYDPSMMSVVLNWQTIPNSGTDTDRMDELCVRIGNPEGHPVLRHFIRSKMIVNGYVKGPIAAFGWRPSLLTSAATNLTRIYDPFATQGSDDGSAISSLWSSGWLPVISEEPVERIRRVNFLYHGLMNVDIESQASAPSSISWGPFTTLSPPDYQALDAFQYLDQQFFKGDGPNKKGRYHRLAVRGNTLNKEWGISMLELVIRGGKEKS